MPNNALEQPFVMEIRNIVTHIESSLNLPSDPSSVTQVIKRVINQDTFAVFKPKYNTLIFWAE